MVVIAILGLGLLMGRFEMSFMGWVVARGMFEWVEMCFNI
jgi:hypothetical protein